MQATLGEQAHPSKREEGTYFSSHVVWLGEEQKKELPKTAPAADEWESLTVSWRHCAVPAPSEHCPLSLAPQRKEANLKAPYRWDRQTTRSQEPGTMCSKWTQVGWHREGGRREGGRGRVQEWTARERLLHQTLTTTYKTLNKSKHFFSSKSLA